ncbi:MAG: LysE family transporter [Pseudomonadota bacterium]
MDLPLLIQGLAIGFSVAAPVGPIGALCVVRTLTRGRLSGLATGLGAAVADAVYGCMGGFGITFLSQILIEQQVWLRAIGGVFLLYLGARTLISQAGETAVLSEPKGLLGDFGSAWVLTLTNPMTIISFGAVFAALGVGKAQSAYLDALLLLMGIFSGSLLWWVVLTFGVSLFRNRIDSHGLGRINRVSGVIIAGFGVAALLSVAFR